MVTLRQGVAGFAIAALVIGFFMVNLIPINFASTSTDTNPSATCSPCPPPTPPSSNSSQASTILSVSSRLVNESAGSTARVAFSVSTSQAVNLTVSGAQLFSVNLSLSHIANPGSYSGVITVSAPAAISPGAYPFVLEAMVGESVVANQSMLLDVPNGPAPSPYYFGVLQSYDVSVTRQLIGSGGSVMSSSRLNSLLDSYFGPGDLGPINSSGGSGSGSSGQTIVPIANTLQYVISISGTPAPNNACLTISQSQFFITVQTVGSGHVSPVAPIEAVNGSGWSLDEFKYTAPLSGSKVTVDLNVSSVIRGQLNAMADPSGRDLNFQQGLSYWNTIIVQAGNNQQVAGANSQIVPVEVLVTIAGCNGQYSTVKHIVDYVQIPLSTSSGSTSSGSGGGSSGPPHQEPCGYMVAGRICYKSLVPQPGPVFGLSFFGIGAAGAPSWAINTSDVIMVVALISFVFDAVTYLKDSKN